MSKFCKSSLSLLPAFTLALNCVAATRAEGETKTPAPKANIDVQASSTKSAEPTKPAAGKKAKTPRVAIDKKTVQELYHSGDFEPLISVLENMRHERTLRDKEDSIFIFKYLGVVYGADMATRRKAEAFLYQLLRLDPQQTLEDLEVGDAIMSLFGQVKKRYERNYQDSTFAQDSIRIRKSLATYGYPIDSTGKNLINPQTGAPWDTVELAKARSKSGEGKGGPDQQVKVKKTDGSLPGWVWVAGGAASAAIAVTGIYLMTRAPETQVETDSLIIPGGN